MSQSSETTNIILNINDADYSTLVESSYSLVLNIIKENPIIYTKQTFENILITCVYDVLKTQFDPIAETCNFENKSMLYILNNATLNDHTEDDNDDDIYDDIIYNIITESIELFYLKCAPKRESGPTYIDQNVNIQEMKKKIAYIESVPQPDQRTEEWYQFRHKFLTASSLWKVFSSDSARNSLIYGKCAPLDTTKYKSCCIDSPMHWGNKYEPVSIMWYENKYKTIVSDFGCIPHANIEYIAASPDGINTCVQSDRYGRMLEVKNIVNRDITGIPKTEYWIQMQLQMEVCDLNECDFLETRFIEYENHEEFVKDGTFTKTTDNKLKGIIMHFMGENNMPLYEYPPLFQTEKEFEKWELDIMKKHQNLTWIQNLYWKLEEISCVLVLRNTMWFSLVLPELNNFWNIIVSERTSGYQHRAPKRKQKDNKKSPDIKPLKCNIDIKKLLHHDTIDVGNDTDKHLKNMECSKNTNVNTKIIFKIETESRIH